MDYESFHRERLLTHTREYVSAIQGDDLIAGIIAGGSLAHGGADRESDVDMLVIVKELPKVERRASWLSAITGHKVHPSSLSGTEDRKWDEFHGQKDDPEQWMGTGGGLLYFTEAEIARDVERVGELLVAFIGRDELERPSHIEEYLADLAHGIVLYDPNGFVADCQQQLAEYPEPARRRLVNYHWHGAEIALNEDLQRAVWRSDSLHAYDRRVEGVRHLVRMLFAMNRRYFRKAKALDRLAAGFDKCPENFWRRLLDALGEKDHMRAGAKLLALAGEMIDLIEPPSS